LAFHSGRGADHSPPSSTEVKEWVELYLYSPNTPSWRGARLGGAQGQFYLYLLIKTVLKLTVVIIEEYHYNQYIQNFIQYFCLKVNFICTRTVWKARGLTLLLRVGILWRCGDGLFWSIIG
jgi:hypothetical protein